MGKRRTPEQVRAEINLEREHVRAGMRELGADTLRGVKLAGSVVALLTLGALALRRARSRPRRRS